MFLCKLLGFGHPDFYIPAVKIRHALLSLAIPAGMYLFGRRVIGKTAARLALWQAAVIEMPKLGISTCLTPSRVQFLSVGLAVA